MDSEKQTNNTCPTHNQEYVAVDMNRQSKVRFLCFICLTTIGKKNNIKSIRDAQIYLQDIKSVYMQRKQEQRNKNLEILKNLTSAIQTLQQFYNQCLDKIIANLKQQEASILKEQQELVTQLQNVDLNCYFSESIQFNKSEQMKNTIETQIQNLNNKDLILKCHELLQSIDDSSITLAPDEQQICNEINQIQHTPYLHLTCEIHKKEIICFDLDQSKAKENRICCIKCIENKPGQLTSLETAFDQWQEYENKKRQCLESQLETGRQRIEIAQLSLKQVSNQFEQKINETNKKLANKLLLIQVQNQEKLDTLNRNWQELTKDEIIEIADFLCQNQCQTVVNQKSEEEYQKFQEQLNDIIQDSLKYLKDALSYCNKSINLKINKFKQREFSNSGSIVVKLEIYYNVITVTFQKSKKSLHHVALQDQSMELLKKRSVIDLTFFGPQIKLQFFEKEISALKETSEQLCKKIKQLEEEKSILCQQNQNNIEQLHQQNLLQGQQKDKQIKLLNEQIQSLDAEKNKAIEKLAYAIDKLNQLQKENEEIKQINEELLNKMNKLEDIQKNHQIKILEFQKQVQSIENEKQEQLKLSSNQLIITQNKLSKLQEELVKTDQIKLHQENQLEQLNRQIIFHKEERDYNLEASKSVINCLTQQGQILVMEKQKLIQELDMQIKLINEQKSQIEQQKQENLEAKQKLNNQNEEHKTINKKQEESLQIMSMKIESSSKQIKQQQEQLQLSQDQQNSLNKQIEKLKEEQNKLDHINQNLNKNNQAKDEQINKQQQEIQQLKADQQKESDELLNIKKLLEDSTQSIEKKEIIIIKLEEQRYQDKIIIEKLKNIIEGNKGILVKVYQKVEIKQQKIINLIDSPYEIIKEYRKKQSDSCLAIAFNKEQTIMVAGSVRNKITVFEFKQGQLNQKQLLSDHTSNYSIYTLYFMSKQNQFISGTKKEIGIWSYNSTTQQWYCLQLLKEAHSDCLNRVIMNKNEDLIISCSDDRTIKFWIKKNEWECSQKLTNHKDYVESICLNESCNQLVSCGYDRQILISQQGGDQKWIVIQSIQVDEFGQRICFIDDNVIVFQPYNGTIMQTYQLDEQRKLYIKSKDIPVQNFFCCNYFFQMQFNNNQQLLVNKNGNRINLIRRQKDDFIIEQSIKFDTNYIFGAMTDDFQYLVTWDNRSQEFQVRKQK